MVKSIIENLGDFLYKFKHNVWAEVKKKQKKNPYH